HLCPYQLEGVNWLTQHFICQNGCILGDEMGIAKTCQSKSDLFVCCCFSLCNGYSYEHVDGSLREERHLAVKNFGQQPSIIFLLNTREGGIGMNLTAADTVIFVDSDFNPQNDLQAAARAHQIGQNKRLIGQDTVEELVYRKAVSKLQLTNMIIGGHFTLGAQKPLADANLQVKYVVLLFKVP
ncbi:Chromodomain-helicase-DNA-binding protein 1-like, partial [Sciurus carolinensis]|nr:Chromodomain-helicase-DNA-binding protein 1-like [Sciurus carolinensis]